ncbi:uncharacterized protein FN964_001807 [Alca torda]
MLLLAALVSTAAWSCGFAQEIPVQSPVSITKSKGSVHLKCHFKDISINFDSTFIHWYRQKANKAPERILYIERRQVVDEGFQGHRYRAEKDSSQKLCILTINDVTPDDTATYYCAYWDPHHDRSGFAQEIPVQSRLSITKSKGSVRLECRFNDISINFDSTFIHWYQQKANKAPERILYLAGTKKVDEGFQEHRYRVEKFSSQKLCILTINDVTPDDTATYYCAYCQNIPWSTWIKYFGTGTKLIVSNKGHSKPSNFEILQKTHKNQIMYVCLIEKFYPEVIQVTWTEGENQKVTREHSKRRGLETHRKGRILDQQLVNCIRGEQRQEIFLTKRLYFRERPSPKQQTLNSSQNEECSPYPGNGTVFNKDHLYHRTAYLVYIVLLLKSSMYYLIVLFFIYRAWAPTKHRGKKA